MLISVGISELKLTHSAEDVIVTYSLGSCVGLTLWDRERMIGGMIHCMLPLSSSNPDGAAARPHMYVDTGVSDFLRQMFELGATRKSLVAKVAGASAMMDDKKLFRIGERNIAVLRKILWKNDIMIAGQDVGGMIPRTMRLYMSDGRVTVKSKGDETDV